MYDPWWPDSVMRGMTGGACELGFGTAIIGPELRCAPSTNQG